MSSTLSKYFSKASSQKRKSSSTSSDNCASPTDFHSLDSKKQEKKKPKIISESSEDSNLEMDELKASIECIKEKLTFVCMREDIEILKEEISKEISKLSETLTRRVDILEGSLYDIQQEKDKLTEDMKQLKKENTSLRTQLEATRKESRDLRGVQNDMEQHGRLWNVRVHGIKEGQRPAEETVSDCIEKCVQLFSQKVGVSVRREDVEIAHRSGRPRTSTMGDAANRPRPILVRFFSRQLKSKVLQNRRKLKQTGISISEDLTMANFKLLKQASDHSATMSAWSSNGKVIAKLKNGATIRLTISADLDEQIRSKMN